MATPYASGNTRRPRHNMTSVLVSVSLACDRLGARVCVVIRSSWSMFCGCWANVKSNLMCFEAPVQCFMDIETMLER